MTSTSGVNLSTGSMKQEVLNRHAKTGLILVDVLAACIVLEPVRRLLLLHDSALLVSRIVALEIFLVFLDISTQL